MRGLAVLLPWLLAGTASAQPADFKDWTVACDNTRHCEAVGFQAEDDGGGTASRPVALWLQRAAGPGTAVSAQFILERPDVSDEARPLVLRIQGLALGRVQPGTPLGPAEAARLLQLLPDANVLTLEGGPSRWTLSLAGAKAALLLMDDLQGRIDTPGALVRKGRKPEASVPPPLAAPRVTPAPLPPPRASDAALLAPILATVRQRDCWDATRDDEEPVSGLVRVSATQLLVHRECGRGAYQVATAYWLARDTPPYDPQPVAFPAPPGDLPQIELLNADFSKGILTTYGKGRGLGDCGSSAAWAWTEEGFRLTHAAVASLCRGIAGGVMVRTWVSEGTDAAR